jgi:hypothetical protein
LNKNKNILERKVKKKNFQKNKFFTKIKKIRIMSLFPENYLLIAVKIKMMNQTIALLIEVNLKQQSN